MLRREDGEAIYRRCSRHPPHHLVPLLRGDRRGRGPGRRALDPAVADEHGYSDVSHTLEIFGTCADC